MSKNALTPHRPVRLAVTLAASLAASATSLAGLALARDFEHRTNLHNRSLYQGMPKPEVRLLKREQGPGVVPVLSSVYQRMQRAGLVDSNIAKEEAGPSKRVLMGAGWKLSVHEDGTRIRFRNRAAVEQNRQQGRRFLLAERMTNEELEDRGRAFVRDHLDGVVVLGEGEEMVALFTEHEIESAESSTGERDPETVAASTVIFGRAIDGVDVVGPGSKLALMFSADGKPIGFDADWPRYRKLAKKQKVHASRELRERASALSSMRMGADVVETRRYECGYVDLGSRRKRRDHAAPIQAGCAVHYEGRRFVADTDEQRAAIAQLPEEAQPHETHAQVDYIPAGVTVERDSGWPQATVACDGGGDQCLPSELGRALLSSEPSAPILSE